MDLRLRAAVAGAELAPPQSKKRPPEVAPSYVEAVVEANKSSAAGMGRLGQNYLHGLNGFPRDAGEAYGWLMRAATAGDARSNYEAALMFETGSPPVGHVDKYAAALMFKRAAENGDRDAEYYLGLYYNDGEGGMPKNLELGAQWIAEAAKRGQTKAIDSLAQHPRPTSAKPALPD
jgi:TPR repeat protein